MDIWQKQIDQYLNQTITADEFVVQFMEHWGEVWSQDRGKPKARKAYGKIVDAFQKRKISLHEFEQQLQDFQTNFSIKWPSPREEAIIVEIFWAAEHYDHPDPQLYLSEARLRDSVQIGHDELIALSPSEMYEPLPTNRTTWLSKTLNWLLGRNRN